jgi:hypothetical protein
VVVNENIWVKDRRRYRSRDSQARTAYRQRVKGMDVGARAIIEAAQPYNHGLDADSVAILNALDSADKHRALVVTASVIDNARLGMHIGGVAQLTMTLPGGQGHRTAVASATLFPSRTDLPTVPIDEEMRRFLDKVPYGEVRLESHATVTVSIRTQTGRPSLEVVPTSSWLSRK